MDTTNLPKTRAEAKAAGAKYYFTGEPCKHGHVAPRKTKGACLECLKLEWEQGKEKRAEYFANYNRSEAGQKAKQTYYERNRDAVIARAQARPDEEKRKYQQQLVDLLEERTREKDEVTVMYDLLIENTLQSQHPVAAVLRPQQRERLHLSRFDDQFLGSHEIDQHRINGIDLPVNRGIMTNRSRQSLLLLLMEFAE